ncbi:LysR family transcriptional regulator [Nocardia sp. NPDC059240]|uniref:LysR family transcriptional regulator n=1 Tax=Nocardia sp. NPDC059240 TaxID=3346786 RepID=UPI0036D0909F
MEIDLGGVRALLAVLEHGHFGRAAQALDISQQALSKRIAALERMAGTRLVDRGTHPIGPTPAATRFLPAAHRLIDAADQARGALHPPTTPLRIDVWGHLFDPMRTLRTALGHGRPIAATIGHARDLAAAASALHRTEIDVGFGRSHHLDGENALAARIVRLEPLDALLSADHPLADAAEIRLTQLREDRLWSPLPLARLDFLDHLATHFGLTTHVADGNLGLDHLLDEISSSPDLFTVIPADRPLPAHPGIRTVPLTHPTPLYAWSLLHRRTDHGERLTQLHTAFAETARIRRWLEYHPDRDWLPEPDLTRFRRQQTRCEVGEVG